jgi:hypothetical protein
MKLTETKKALEIFSNYVIQQSRTRLTKKEQNVTSKLYNSLKYDLDEEDDGFIVDYKMEDYGKFQDKGVRGIGGVRKTTSKFNRRNNKGKMWKQKGGNSPFSFKEGNKPSVKHFVSWANSKGLSPFAVREAVYHQGIKPTQFFSKSFDMGFKKLPKELQEAFKIDVEFAILLAAKK